MKKIAILILALVLLAGCSRSQYYQRSFPLMGTIVKIKVENSTLARNVLNEAIARMKELEREVYNSDSQDFHNLLQLSIYLKEKTGGAFDVYYRPDKKLDFGAIGKGYIVDKAAEVLKKGSIKNGIIDAGGDIFCAGDNDGSPWVVGIRDPQNKKNIIAKIKIKDKAVATSGEYERKCPHIIDPRTGNPPRNNILSTTVISDKCAIADGLATALFVLKPEEGIALIEKLDGIDCVIISKENDKIRFHVSSDITGGIEIR